MNHAEGALSGAGGLALFYQCWRPEEPPKAVLAIVHGLGEHSGRYRNVVEHVVPLGYAVYAFDLRGHGRSGGTRAHINAWSEFREDVHLFLRLVREAERGLPLFLMGHSMGGLIVLNYALHEPEGLSGVIASAPGLDTSGLSPVMLALARVLSKVAPRLRLPSGLEVKGISRDPAVVQAYRDDPLVHDAGTPRLAMEGQAAIAWTLAHAEEWQLPLLLYYGTADRLVPPAEARAFFERIPHPDKTLHAYPDCYHELHNDLEHEQAIGNLASWLEDHLPVQQAANRTKQSN